MSVKPLALIDHLLSFEIPLVIIGGHAVNRYDYLRATEDSDIIFHRTTDSEHRLCDALTEVDAFWITDQIDPKMGIEKTVPVDMPFIRANRLMMPRHD